MEFNKQYIEKYYEKIKHLWKLWNNNIDMTTFCLRCKMKKTMVLDC
jgi:hypothetical protein